MKTTDKQRNPFIRYLMIGGLLLIPLVLMLLPSDFWDHGRPMCVSRILLNVECYGCGMTRAIHRILHLDFAGAAMFNKLSFIVFPLLCMLWLKLLLSQFGIRILKWF